MVFTLVVTRSHQCEILANEDASSELIVWIGLISANTPRRRKWNQAPRHQDKEWNTALQNSLDHFPLIKDR